MRPALVLALLPLAACSFVAVRGPVSLNPPVPGECTESSTPPVGDIVVAAAATLVGAASIGVMVSCSNNSGEFAEAVCDGSPGFFIPLAIGAVAVAIVSGVSAGYGFSKTGDCRAARAGTGPVSDARLSGRP